MICAICTRTRWDALPVTICVREQTCLTLWRPISNAPVILLGPPIACMCIEIRSFSALSACNHCVKSICKSAVTGSRCKLPLKSTNYAQVEQESYPTQTRISQPSWYFSRQNTPRSEGQKGWAECAGHIQPILFGLHFDIFPC